MINLLSSSNTTLQDERFRDVLLLFRLRKWLHRIAKKFGDLADKSFLGYLGRAKAITHHGVTGGCGLRALVITRG
jgi:hypothetical protein